MEEKEKFSLVVLELGFNRTSYLFSASLHP